MNLAINAGDAMPDGGVLQIRAFVMTLESERSFSYVTQPVGRYVAIAISDSGIGILPEVRERMFDPFFTTKPRRQGTGLGLSASLGILQSHNGAVDVQSKIDQGTTITVIFPSQA